MSLMLLLVYCVLLFINFIIYFMFVQFLIFICDVQTVVYNMTMLLLNIKILFNQWPLVTHETAW